MMETKYTAIKELGKGAFGTTWRAKRKSDNVVVVAKVRAIPTLIDKHLKPLQNACFALSYLTQCVFLSNLFAQGRGQINQSCKYSKHKKVPQKSFENFE